MNWVTAASCLMLALSLANFLEDWALAFFTSPDGGWDAWSIWNLHARFLTLSEAWRAGFTSTIVWWSHPDYPLLLPAFIANVWAYIGNPTQLVPALVDLCFLLCMLGLLVSAVNQARGWQSAVFAGLFLLPVLHSSVDYQQYADMPLAFFILAANLFLWRADETRKNQKSLLVLAGFMTGAAVWAKNEGWMLVAAVGLVEILKALVEKPRFGERLKRWLWLAAGFAPLAVTTLVFKMLIAPPNDMVSGFQWNAALSYLTDFSRYAQIWQSFQAEFFSGQILTGGLPIVLLVFVLVVGWNDDRQRNLRVLWIGVRMLIIAILYFFIFVVDSYPLTWHLSTAMTRLVAHLFPSLILTACLLARSLGQAPDAGAEPGPSH